MADKYFNARINPGLAFKAKVGRWYLFPVTGRQRQTAQDMHRVRLSTALNIWNGKLCLGIKFPSRMFEILQEDVLLHLIHLLRVLPISTTVLEKQWLTHQWELNDCIISRITHRCMGCIAARETIFYINGNFIISNWHTYFVYFIAVLISKQLNRQVISFNVNLYLTMGCILSFSFIKIYMQNFE